MRELSLSPLAESGLLIDIGQYLGLWAVEESAFATQWLALTEMGLAAHFAAGPRQKTQPTATKSPVPNIAQIEIRGMMTKNGSSFSDAGATSLIRRQARAAKDSADIDGALILIESPGGTVAGNAELAADLEALSSAKPTITLFEDIGTSAALWAGVMSSKVYANTEHAMVGSMGTYMALYDMSVAAAQQGIKPVIIRTGELKAAGFPGTEITTEQKANFQAWVDQAHSAFSGAVQRRRSLNKEQMAELSKGGMYSAKAAIGLGLIDGIRSYEAVVAELRSMVSTKKRSVKMSEGTTALAASLTELEADCRGAGPDFLVGQLKKGATVAAASGEWMNHLTGVNLDLTNKLKASEDALKASQDENAKLKTELESVKKGKSSQGGSYPTTNGLPGGKQADTSESATMRFDAAVAEKVKGGMSKPKAIAAIVQDDPELHSAYLEEHRQGRR